MNHLQTLKDNLPSPTAALNLAQKLVSTPETKIMAVAIAGVGAFSLGLAGTFAGMTVTTISTTAILGAISMAASIAIPVAIPLVIGGVAACSIVYLFDGYLSNIPTISEITSKQEKEHQTKQLTTLKENIEKELGQLPHPNAQQAPIITKHRDELTKLLKQVEEELKRTRALTKAQTKEERETAEAAIKAYQERLKQFTDVLDKRTTAQQV